MKGCNWYNTLQSIILSIRNTWNVFICPQRMKKKFRNKAILIKEIRWRLYNNLYQNRNKTLFHKFYKISHTFLIYSKQIVNWKIKSKNHIVHSLVYIPTRSISISPGLHMKHWNQNSSLTCVLQNHICFELFLLSLLKISYF